MMVLWWFKRRNGSQVRGFTSKGCNWAFVVAYGKAGVYSNNDLS